MVAPPIAQNAKSSARSWLNRTPVAANSSAVISAWNRAAPGSERPMTWCQPSAPMMQTSIANNATTVNLSARIVRSMAKVWKLVGPLKATDMLMYW